MAAEQFQQLHAYLNQQIIGQHALTKVFLSHFSPMGIYLLKGLRDLLKHAQLMHLQTVSTATFTVSSSHQICYPLI